MTKKGQLHHRSQDPGFTYACNFAKIGMPCD